MTKQHSYANTVRQKVQRMRAARKRPDSLFRSLAQVGTLSWMFIVPVVLSAFVGRLLARWLGIPQVALGLLALGLALGGYLVWRQLLRSLDKEEDNHDVV